MVKQFTFTVPGPVVPQARPRAAMVAGHIAMHDTRECQSYKMDVASCASRAMAEAGLKAPVEPDDQGFTVTIYINKAYLKRLSKKKIEQAKMGMLLPLAKPDLDNAAKGILDALKSVFWKDDSAVTSLYVTKRYAPMDSVAVDIIWKEKPDVRK